MLKIRARTLPRACSNLLQKLIMSSNTQKSTTTVDPALLEHCGCKRERLSNACHYSFQDLYRAKCAALGQAGDNAAEACAALYKRDRDAINETVREWAEARNAPRERRPGVSRVRARGTFITRSHRN